MIEKDDNKQKVSSEDNALEELLALLKIAEQKGFLFYDFQSDTIMATHRLALSDSELFNQIKDLKNVSSLPNNLLRRYVHSLQIFLQV